VAKFAQLASRLPPGCYGKRFPKIEPWHFRPFFAYTTSMFHAPTSGLYPFVIACKGCRKNIPAPVETMPDCWIIADSPLCGQKRRYLPTDIFRGRLSDDLVAKDPRGVRPR
jgi:hypothetical protein